MMKLITLLLLLSIPRIASSQNNLIINGNAPLIKDGTKIIIRRVMPRRFSARKSETDSAYIKSNRFEFKLKDNNGEFYSLTIGKHRTQLYLQPGIANVTLSDSLLANVTISGNLMADEYDQFKNQVKNDPVHLEYIKVSRDYSSYAKNKKANADTLAAKSKKRDELTELDDKLYERLALTWIQTHPGSYLNPYLLYSAYNQPEQTTTEAQVKRIFSAMPANITHNVWGQELKYKIDSLFVGGKAPDFAQADTSGKQVKLSDFKGKYVLIDFWASWCVPCRAETPNIVKASQQIGSRNFSILGISLDSEKAPWLRAIKQDGLNWFQLSDLGLWRNNVSVKYYVYDIPANYLIDPNGIIIAKNINGDELLPTLKKLIK
ncbi:TlpA disulfide reductase family protein [Mucilaginibacter sp. OK098]|uniref:TlpA disulfide reductase family protein n=1 Tax=Mucilaginibacter sp. OK098 TaxID=1855297 RepID=UPI000919FF7F|nr:TlpA disulfide reductase family protein [Mucilaginibacter sp. OK098]SHN31887.1 Peroxiredoxin [Mucilaginibacter sp. OK098]